MRLFLLAITLIIFIAFKFFDTDNSYQNKSTHDEYLNVNKPDTTIIIYTEDNIDTLYGKSVGETFLFEGDIIIDPYQFLSLAMEGNIATSKPWPENNINFIIDEKLKIRKEVCEAIELWDEKTVLSFSEKTLSDSIQDLIYFTYAPEAYLKDKRFFGAASYIGYLNGAHFIFLADRSSTGNVAHEIGHILGLFHEHVRSDRDTYIYYDCGKESTTSELLASSNLPDSEVFGEYDFYSIMHYAINYSCMWPNDDYIDDLPIGIPGQRDSLSTGDIMAINSIYENR